jgi:DNA end-binding protein Ku
MAARPTWKGYLKVSLVTVPVRVFPATSATGAIRFNQLHAECQTRVRQKKWCEECDREVDKSEIVKGFEFEKGRYVVVDEEDLAKARPESTRIINLLRFADVDSIDPMYVERPYYLAPDGKVAASAFAVLREALTGKAGIGKLALLGREYLVAVQPREKGLVMFTLRQASEVRRMSGIEELEELPETVSEAEVALAKQVIGNFAGDLDLKEFSDEYQSELRRIIDAKVAGEEVVESEVEAPAKVVNLMEALRKSLDSVSRNKDLDQVSTSKKKPVKAPRKRAPRAATAAAPDGAETPARRRKRA